MNIWTTRYIAAAFAGHYAYRGDFWGIGIAFLAYAALAYGKYSDQFSTPSPFENESKNESA